MYGNCDVKRAEISAISKLTAALPQNWYPDRHCCCGALSLSKVMLNKVLASERKLYIRIVFSHWPRLCFDLERNRGQLRNVHSILVLYYCSCAIDMRLMQSNGNKLMSNRYHFYNSPSCARNLTPEYRHDIYNLQHFFFGAISHENDIVTKSRLSKKHTFAFGLCGTVFPDDLASLGAWTSAGAMMTDETKCHCWKCFTPSKLCWCNYIGAMLFFLIIWRWATKWSTMLNLWPTNLL